MYENLNSKVVGFTPLGLMFQNNSGNVPTEADLIWWREYPEPDTTYPLAIDAYGSVANPWDINFYTPFNFILDKNFVCRYKMIGFSSAVLTPIIEALQAE